MNGRPIRPHQVDSVKTGELVPAEVFNAFNELIARNWDGTQAKFTQDAAVDAIVKRIPGLERHLVFERHYLDVERSYERAGWHVEYDKPGYNESYAATFTFKRLTRVPMRIGRSR
jgi:hypothetical protein